MNDIDVEKLIKILPKLIKENDTVKGAIISALSSVVATKEDIKELINVIDKRFEVQSNEIRELARGIKELNVAVNRIETKEGTLLQDMVLDLLKETLKLEKIDPSKIRRQPLIDSEGLVFYSGYSTDIDVILEDDKVYLIEIKATAGSEDVNQLLFNAKLYERVMKRKPDQLILATLRISQKILELARSQKIRVIAGGILTI